MLRGCLPLAFLAASLVAAPAAGGIRELAFESRALVLAKRNLNFAPRALEYSTPALSVVERDLVFRTEDLLRVVETEKEITIELPAGVLFDTESTEFQASAAFALQEAVSILRARAPGEVRIEGYPGIEAAPADGQRLSAGRAQSVERWLAKESGLTTLKFASSGAATRQPGQPPPPSHVAIVFAKP